MTGFHYDVQRDPAELMALFTQFITRARAVRRLGSAALDLCYVAAGRFEGFWEQKLHPWDVAGGALLVEEAGGRVTGVDGTAYSSRSGSVLATNGRVHDRDARRDPRVPVGVGPRPAGRDAPVGVTCLSGHVTSAEDSTASVALQLLLPRTITSIFRLNPQPLVAPFVLRGVVTGDCTSAVSGTEWSMMKRQWLWTVCAAVGLLALTSASAQAQVVQVSRGA